MSTTAFSLTYEGDAVKAGQMNVEELAPALLAAGKLLEEANLITNGGEVKLSVQVSARFEHGSFHVNLAVDQAFIQHIAGLFIPGNLTDVRGLLELLLGSGGLIGLLRALKGKKPVIDKTNSGVSIRAEDGSTVNYSPIVVQLYENPEIRRSVYPLAKPLEREGIDSLDVKAGNRRIQRINKADLPVLAPAGEDEILHEAEYETTLRIVAISFQENNKWRLAEGDKTYFYAIEDDAFLKKIDQQNEVFAKDDLLKARVRIIVRRTIEGEIKTDRILTEIVEHIRRPKQTSFQRRMETNDE